MASTTTIKTVGATGTFSTPQLWEDGAPASLTTAERSTANSFTGTFIQGEPLTFAPSTATGVFLDSDGSTYITYGVSTGNIGAADVATGTTSLAVCTIPSGTPDFTGVIWQGQQQNQTFSGAGTQLTISGSTSSATAYKEYTTVAGASFSNNVNVQTNALRYNSANGAALNTTGASTLCVALVEPSARFNKLQVAATGATSRGMDSGSTHIVATCIIEGTYTAVSTTNGVGSFRATSTIKNCLFVQRATGANHVVTTATGSPSFFNCTFVAADDLATAPTSVLNSGASGTVTVQNGGLFAGDSTKAVTAGSATFNFTTCYSDISGTAGVTQTTYGSEFQDVNDATQDFRLKTGAAQIDTGTTDSVNAPIDIAGTARPQGAAYDVGAWEFVQSVVGTVLTGFGRIFKGYG